LRKHLAAATCAGMALTPVTVALAANDEDGNDDNQVPDISDVALAQQRLTLPREAGAKLRLAAKRAERNHARHAQRIRGDGAATGGSIASPQLQAIAACESGGNPRAIGGGGAFRGKYQFTYGTWSAVGGTGDPAAAPEAEQDRRAAMLLARSGSSPWPVCGS
jgi:Transglycosylase-like domain